jgi:hypothetical protein
MNHRLPTVTIDPAILDEDDLVIYSRCLRQLDIEQPVALVIKGVDQIQAIDAFLVDLNKLMTSKNSLAWRSDLRSIDLAIGDRVKVDELPLDIGQAFQLHDAIVAYPDTTGIMTDLGIAAALRQVIGD